MCKMQHVKTKWLAVVKIVANAEAQTANEAFLWAGYYRRVQHWRYGSCDVMV